MNVRRVVQDVYKELNLFRQQFLEKTGEDNSRDGSSERINVGETLMVTVEQRNR